MKRIVLCCVIAVACFAQLDIVDKKLDSRHGFFFGAGLGVGANAMEFKDPTVPYDIKRSSASFVVSAKLGGYSYFTKMFGLRYYYNLDVNFNPQNQDGQVPGFYAISGSHTLNADAIINVFHSKDFEVAVLAGIGMGVVAGESGSKVETVYTKNSNFVDFDFRFNLGARVMFDQKYGIELMAKLPVMPATYLSYSPTGRYVRSSPYYFTIDFVMERF